MTDCGSKNGNMKGKQKGWVNTKPKFEVRVKHPTEKGGIMFSKQYPSLTSIHDDFKDSFCYMTLSRYATGKREPPPLFEFINIRDS